MSSGGLPSSGRADKENTLPRSEALAGENATPSILRHNLYNYFGDLRRKNKIAKFPLRLG
jgi:hypothetical protein